MLKRDEGYGHAIKLTFNTANVTSKSGTITGRMNCYIPISKVKFLFEEKKNEHEKIFCLFVVLLLPAIFCRLKLLRQRVSMRLNVPSNISIMT